MIIGIPTYKDNAEPPPTRNPPNTKPGEQGASRPLHEGMESISDSPKPGGRAGKTL